MEAEEVHHHQADLEIIKEGDPRMENIKAILAAARLRI
jgi:UDP-N-acetylmuramyl tripeptide synthase